MSSQNPEVLKENAQLRQWKQSMMTVESTWDEQAIGRLIGVPLGQPIRAAIQPYIIVQQYVIEALRAELADAKEENEVLKSDPLEYARVFWRKELAVANTRAEKAERELMHMKLSEAEFAPLEHALNEATRNPGYRTRTGGEAEASLAQDLHRHRKNGLERAMEL